MLLSILLALVTFTVESKSSVSVVGTLPAASRYSYESTYQKGTMTAGNSITLTLDGWEQQQIESISLSMHSNKTTGAGNLSLTADGRTVWSIAEGSFASPQWHGAYTDEWVDIAHSFEQSYAQGRQLKLHIYCSYNSLYINTITIRYHQEPPRPYTVSLRDAEGHSAPLTESATGAGIILPNSPDLEDEWHFVGWSPTPIEGALNTPVYLLPGTPYRPSYDVVLYALYTNNTTPSIYWAQTEPVTGPYLFTTPILSIIHHGDVLSGRLEVDEAEIFTLSERAPGDNLWQISTKPAYADQVYYAHFPLDTLLSLQNAQSLRYITWQSGKLAAGSTEFFWSSQLHPDGTRTLYHEDGNGHWDVMIFAVDNVTGNLYITLYRRDTPPAYSGNMMALFPVDLDAEPTMWTTYPHGHVDVPVIQLTDDLHGGIVGENIIPLGNYLLYILHHADGSTSKYLRLR